MINFIYFNVKILLTGIFFTHRCQCKPYLKVSFGKKDTDVSTKKRQISLDSAVHLVFLLARLCSTNYNVLSLVKRKASEQLVHLYFIPSNQAQIKHSKFNLFGNTFSSQRPNPSRLVISFLKISRKISFLILRNTGSSEISMTSGLSFLSLLIPYICPDYVFPTLPSQAPGAKGTKKAISHVTVGLTI